MKRHFSGKLIAFMLCVCIICSYTSAFAVETTTFDTYGDFSYSVTDGEITITRCREEVTGEIIIPKQLNSMPVTAIADSAFEFCTEITKVNIPNTVKTIGSFAFVYCWSLESVEIPDSVTTIGSSAFEGCTALETASLGSGVNSIGTYAFTGCDMLESISVSDKNSTFSSKNGALYSKDGKTLFTYPASCGAEAVVADGAEEIGISAFGYCMEITNVKLPEGLKKIGKYAFNGCTALQSVQIPSTLEYIDELAFRDCVNLTEVTIPQSVDYIGNNAFFGCETLKNAVFEGNAPSTMDESVFVGVSEEFSITYDPAFASSWAPNGETEFMGYPLVAMSKDPASTIKIKDGSTLSIKNGMLKGIDDGMTAANLLAQLEATGGITVKNKNGENVPLTDVLSTGDRLILSVDGEEKESLTIIVTGDVTSDGKVNSRDIASLQRHVMEVALLNGAALLAGDINGDENINSRDLASVQRIVAS